MKNHQDHTPLLRHTTPQCEAQEKSPKEYLQEVQNPRHIPSKTPPKECRAQGTLHPRLTSKRASNWRPKAIGNVRSERSNGDQIHK